MSKKCLFRQKLKFLRFYLHIVNNSAYPISSNVQILKNSILSPPPPSKKRERKEKNQSF
jgi:hypothetical protein